MRVILLTCFLFCGILNSTEVDSFTLRDPFLQDAVEELNQLMQGYFDRALDKANQKESCEPEVFEDALHHFTDGLFWAQIEKDIENSPTIDKRIIERTRSIYQDISFLYGPALYMARLGFILKIGDLYIGSDKFGHFIDQGYDYFEEEDLIDALDHGEMTENTYYGLTSTAVYSNGDLAANLDGYYFWKQVARGRKPYVTCQNNKWEQTRAFDWRDYANPAWDEAINCSLYRNQTVTNQVMKRIADLKMTCPIDKSYCPIMIQRYGLLSARVITRECF